MKQKTAHHHPKSHFSYVIFFVALSLGVQLYLWSSVEMQLWATLGVVATLLALIFAVNEKRHHVENCKECY